MNKFLALAAGASLFLLAGSVSAASITNVEFENGDVEIQDTGGSTVEATFRIVVPDGEVVEQLEVDVEDSPLGPICESVGGSRGLEEGTHYVERDIKLPPNTGTYDIDVQASGIFGGQRAIDCENDVVASESFYDAVRVVGSNDDDDDFGDDDEDMPSWLAALIEMLKPKNPAYCAQIGTVSLYGTTGANVSAVQTTLISNGFSIPAGATGFWGNQTNAAWAAARANCN